MLSAELTHKTCSESPAGQEERDPASWAEAWGLPYWGVRVAPLS